MNLIMVRLMKMIVNKPRVGEKGLAMILTMIVMLVGSLIIAPLLGFMSTGLMATKASEERMIRLYTADAGVEEAFWKIMNNDASLPETVGDTWTLPEAVINGKGVGVMIELVDDIESFLEEFLGIGAGPHDDWTVIEDVVGAGTYTITIIYSGNAQVKRLNGVGVWLLGDYQYAVGSASGMTADYPVFTFTEHSFKVGTALMWEWTGGNRPEFGNASGVYEMSLTFGFTPGDIPDLCFSWLVGGSMDIGVVPGAQTFGVMKVVATAIDSATGKQTEIITYTYSYEEPPEPPSLDIITWEINVQ